MQIMHYLIKYAFIFINVQDAKPSEYIYILQNIDREKNVESFM